MKEIVSCDNALIKSYSALRDRKNREKERLFIFEGHKLYTEAKENGISPVSVLFTRNALERYPFLESEERGIIVSDRVYAKLTEERSPEGVATVCAYLPSHTEYKRPEGKTLLFLCGIRDPGNVGTILRTAKAFGFPDVVMTSDCADVYSHKTVRASMGAVFTSNTYRADDIVKAIEDYRRASYKVYATVLSDRAEPLNALSAESAVFVLGNEGHGLDKSVRDACSGDVIIPMEAGTESLNVSSAASVILWEAYRRRIAKE